MSAIVPVYFVASSPSPQVGGVPPEKAPQSTTVVVFAPSLVGDSRAALPD
jgi:hypothetical protein